MNIGDRKRLIAAQGWVELGDWQSANDELEEIAPGDRAHPEVLLVRCDIYALAGKWDMAEPVATTLATQMPRDWRPCYVLAKCKANLGNFFAAQMFLEQAFELCPEDIRERALLDPHLEPLWRNVGSV